MTSPAYRKTFLKVQQVLIDLGAEVKTVHVDKRQLEPGVERTDISVKNVQEVGALVNAHSLQSAKDATIRLLRDKMDETFDDDGSGNFWNGYHDSRDDKYIIVVGVDWDEEGDPCVSVEEQSEEFFRRQGVLEARGKAMKSFKAFVTEARKPGVTYKEEKTKGVVVKIIATLEGHEAGQLTKVAGQYKKILAALDKLEKAKAELNERLKSMVGDSFDPELDKYCTRVIASAQFTASLAKETHPNDIKEKVEIRYEALVAGLMELLTADLQPAAAALLEACTHRYKPDPKSPALRVDKLEEGVVEAFLTLWRSTKALVQKHCLSADKRMVELNERLDKFKALVKAQRAKAKAAS